MNIIVLPQYEEFQLFQATVSSENVKVFRIWMSWNILRLLLWFRNYLYSFLVSDYEVEHALHSCVQWLFQYFQNVWCNLSPFQNDDHNLTYHVEWQTVSMKLVSARWYTLGYFNRRRQWWKILTNMPKFLWIIIKL